MASYLHLLYSVVDGVATVTLNRPRVLNALNSALLTELDAAFTAAREDAGVRVVLLTGAGERAFAAGADISEFAATDAAAGERWALHGQAVLRGIETCGKPVIACVNGFALGGGCELALACTLRIASESAQFGQPEVKLGFNPGYGGTQRLPRVVGASAALKLMLTGEPIDAREALRIGLADEVVGQAELMARGLSLARRIASVAPLAVAGCLEAVTLGADLPLDEACAVEAEIFGRLSATDDKREGVAAFLEKRPASWVGR